MRAGRLLGVSSRPGAESVVAESHGVGRDVHLRDVLDRFGHALIAPIQSPQPAPTLRARPVVLLAHGVPTSGAGLGVRGRHGPIIALRAAAAGDPADCRLGLPLRATLPRPEGG